MAALLAGCQGEEAALDSDISVPVSVQTISHGSIEQYLGITGTVNATAEASLLSEISGHYQLLKNPATKRPFALGDKVKAGQRIIHFEDAEFENTIKLKAQKLNLDISKREFDKQTSLYKKGGVTLRELKNAEVAYINAKYAYEKALIQVAKMDVKAPFSGVITDLPYYTPGVRTAANKAMVSIMDYSTLYMDINLPDKYMQTVKVAQPVRIMNYTLQHDTLQGKVTQISPAIDQNTRTFKASLRIDNRKWLLRPGMFVKGDLILAQRDSTLVIPKNIVLSRQRGKTIFVVQRGAASERIITTGLENPTQVEVLKGLRAEERLVTKGFETLRNRSVVKIIQ